jgi:S-adenosylmethionine synthetase
MTVTWNDKIVLEHTLRFLVTTRSQIYFGQDPTFGKQETFSGHIWAARPELLEANAGK